MMDERDFTILPMTTHDTAAALEAAIDAYGNATAREAENADERTALHRAITAHVEAEVARRLAPNLELWRWKCHDETIEQAIERLVRERNEYAEKLCERNAALVMAPDVEAAIDRLDMYADPYRADALRAAIAADKARAVEAAEDAAFLRGRDAVRKIARLTPYEAEALVERFEGLAQWQSPGYDAARADLLAALTGKDPT